MYTKQEIIIRYHREGQSQRQISKDLLVSRKTVKKYIDNYASSIKQDAGIKKSLHEDLSAVPKYKSANRSKTVLTQQVTRAIDALLDLNKEKRLQGLNKQLLKKCDILVLLHNQGHKIGYTTVCNYIKSKKNKRSEAFIRQRYEPGSVCEFDWGEVVIFIEGVRTKLQMAVFTSAYSNYRFAYLYHRQDTLAFMESHVLFFAHTRGIYHQMTYDNMRVAVARFVGKHEKEPTQALINLKGHYQFTHRFCNAYRGNEKGHVERSVEYVRRKAFAFKDNFSSLEQANKYLIETLEKLNNLPLQKAEQSPQVLFEQEKEVLWNWSGSFSCYATEQARVDKFSTISFGSNRYSVPDYLVGEFIDVKIFSSKLEFYHHDALLCEHLRNYGLHQWIISIGHYLDTLYKKPGALAGSEALYQSNQYLQKLHSKYYLSKSRDFIELLLYCAKHELNWERLQEAELYLITICPDQISTDKLTAYLGNKPEEEVPTFEIEGQIEQASKAQLKEFADLFY
jgi:transposase/predicted transcriptional regulator